MKYPSGAIQCTKFLTITIQDKNKKRNKNKFISEQNEMRQQ